MNKLEFKKTLTDLRNDYIEYKKELDNDLIKILGMSFVAQSQYLDFVTFNLISSNNIIKSNIGSIIAYKLFWKRTNRDLLDISTFYFDKYNETKKELKRSNIEFNKICNAIEFINSVDENELEKYLSYKMN